MEVLNIVIECIKEISEDENKNNIGENEELINDIGIDSLQFINLLLDLEEKLNLCLDYEEIDFDKLITVKDLVAFLEGAMENA